MSELSMERNDHFPIRTMDGWEERMSQPPDVNRCPICGLTDQCETHLLCMAVRLDDAAHKLNENITAMQRIVERMGLPP